ncbi:MAG: DUF1854 domain-containing protein [Candidatus Poribacteria bacterium]|nr:DUF1854 domain-containing protein [Candidatus Poribacteria bacterium]
MAVEGNEIIRAKSDAERAVTPIQVTHPEHVDARDLRLFRKPPWALRMTIEGDRSYLKVRIVRAAPLSQPSRYICFLDEKNEVICMVTDPNVLDAESRRIVQEELDQRYLTAIIDRIHSLRNEFGVGYWDVETDRGRREFVVRNVSENAQWLSESRLLLVDVDGNRFEVPDLNALDKKSLGFIEMVF